MGQSGQKIKQRLKQIGIGSLPNSYQKGQDNFFKSQTSSTVLTRITVLLNPNEVDSYLLHLQFRKMHKELVQILYVDLKCQQTDYCKLHVYIENMPLRLSQTFSFHFNKMVKILCQALKGFKILYEKYGYFTIDASLISINDEGMVKCWMNQKYSVSAPKPCFSYKKVTKGQTSMCEQLKEVFNCQVDKRTAPPKFFLQGKTFSELINELSQKLGEQFINQKLDLNSPIPKESVLKQNLRTAPSSYRSPEHKISSGTQIRFNYQMKEPARSNIRITFNNNKSVEVTRGTSTSLQKNEKAKINFSYQQKVKTAQTQLQKSLIHEIQNTKADDIENNLNKRVVIQGH